MDISAYCHLNIDGDQEAGIGIQGEHKIRVNKWNITYLQSGHGPNYLLCLTGGVGDGITFKPVLKGMDPNKFTVIAWDPPGLGKSIPPYRFYSDNYLEEEADVAYEFMKTLNISRYSVLGLCEGGRVGMILASEHPEQVERLVLLGTSSFYFSHDLEALKTCRDVKTWSMKTKECLYKAYNYNDRDLERLMGARIDAVENLYIKRNGDFCSKILEFIQCKTLVLCGAKDPLVDASHAIYLNKNIKNSRIHVYPEGRHSVHFSETEDFNKRVEQFILEGTGKIATRYIS